MPASPKAWREFNVFIHSTWPVSSLCLLHSQVEGQNQTAVQQVSLLLGLTDICIWLLETTEFCIPTFLLWRTRVMVWTGYGRIKREWVIRAVWDFCDSGFWLVTEWKQNWRLAIILNTILSWVIHIPSTLHRKFLSVWIQCLKNEGVGVTGRLFHAADDTEQQTCKQARHFSVGCTENTQP